MNTLLKEVKANLILDFDDDDSVLNNCIDAALTYAEGYQHIPPGSYAEEWQMSPHTKQAVIMLASHLYESRDGSGGGFFNNRSDAAKQVWETVNRLLILDREWKV